MVLLSRRTHSPGPSRVSAAAFALALLAGAHASSAEAERGAAELTVYAAASLRDVLAELRPALEEASGAVLVFNLGSSGDLARQIVAAAKADVFLSAGEKEMDEVEREGLVEAGTRRVLVSNQLVVVEPFDRAEPSPSLFAQPFKPEQVAAPHVKRLSLASPATVPAGRYAKAWLEQRSLWERVASRVLPAVDVRAALAAVESGGAQAGIVYRSDAALARRARIVHAVPLEEGPRIVYPIAAIRGRPQLARATRLLERLASAESLEAFVRAGFVATQRTDPVAPQRTDPR
jgi:molybdate transport system substrate-binding protein